MRRVFPPILRIAAACLALVLAQSVWWSPGSSPALSIGLAALALVSWWRPVRGLVLVAALAPFGRLIVIGLLEGYPIRGAEAFVLAWLSGLAVRQVHAPRPDGALPAHLVGPWVLFGSATVASAAVLHRVSQLYFDAPVVYVERLLAFLAFNFHGLPGEPRPWLEPASFGYAITAALVLEGIALVLVTARLCREEPGLGRRLLAVSVASAGLAGALSLWAFTRDAMAVPMESLPGLLHEGRWAVHVNKVNTAGSYFVLLAAPALALAWRGGRRRKAWTLVAALILSGLLLTASLAAIVGGVVVASGVLVVRAFRATDRRPAVRWTAIGLAAALFIAGGLRIAIRPESTRSVHLRWAITWVSLDTAAEAPVFGVGIGAYPIRSIPHVTPVVRQGFGEGGVPAHNYLLQIGTELGIVGLGLFLWALFGLARTAAGAAPGVPASDRWDRPAALGVAAFLISSLSGQPMLVDNVAIPAFLLMGICLVGAERPRPGRRALWIPVGGLAILATVPWRAALEVEQMDPRRTGYGTTFGEADDRRLVHFLDGPARLFAHRSAPFIRIEARALEGEGPNEVFLNVSGPGIVPRTFALRPDGSLTACIPLDPGAREPMGLRPLDVQVVQAGGAPAPPRSAWALVTGSERPCQ